MNNLEIKKAIRENRQAKMPKEAWTEHHDLMVNKSTMEAEKAMKTARENLPGMSRMEAWAMVRDDFLTAKKGRAILTSATRIPGEAESFVSSNTAEGIDKIVNGLNVLFGDPNRQKCSLTVDAETDA